MKPIPPVKPGDPISAELYNAIAEKLEQKLALTVAQGGGLTILKTPRGRVLGLTIPRPIWAQLSGTSSPYSWQEIESVSGGTWATFGQRSGTSNAYECNGKGGLGSKVVQLWKTSAGDWRFCYEGLGCNPATTGVKFTVNGCQGSPLQGATVTVTQGSNTYTCTTDANGQCTIGLSSTASYTWSATYSSRLTTASGGPSTPSCGVITPVTASLTAATGHICCANNYAYPTTLYLSTSAGTVTLTYDGAQSAWVGTINVSTLAWTAVNCTVITPTCCADCTGGTSTQTIPVQFVLTCSQLSEGWNIPAACSDGSTPTCLPLALGSCTNPPPGATGSVLWPSQGAALPQTFTLPSSDGGGSCASPINGSGILSE